MGGKKSKPYVSTPSKTITTTIATSSKVAATTTAIPSKTTTASLSAASQTRQRIAQNFILVWVDAGIDHSNKDNQETLARLRNVVNDVTIFSQPEQCVQFLNQIDDEKAFVIVSGSLGQQLVPDIHAMPQLDAIYVFCGNKSRHEQWTRNWIKVKGVHIGLTPICKALQIAVKQCNEDNVSINFVSVNEGTSSENLNTLEASFMYTQIFKEVILETEFNKQSIKHLTIYCRKFYDGNKTQLNIIDEFERDYHPQLSIWWYTRECFTYQMLNRALRNMETDTIINMGFFIRDLHCQIKQLHQKQISDYREKSFIVYRGQSLSTANFEKLRKTKGGLISFNNFLTTSTKRDVSLEFSKNALGKKDKVGILFEMTIDPSVTSAPFAAIGEISFFQTEEEILFSMHTVFCIDGIKQIDSNSSLYQVELHLTSEDNPQLRSLTKLIPQETPGSTGWQRLGHLLLKINQFNKAEELYNALLQQTSDESEKVIYYNQLGCANNDQGEYEKAIWYYEHALELRQKFLPSNHPELATSYSKIGLVYYNMGQYSKALSYFERALDINQRSLPPDHSQIQKLRGYTESLKMKM